MLHELHWALGAVRVRLTKLRWYAERELRIAHHYIKLLFGLVFYLRGSILRELPLLIWCFVVQLNAVIGSDKGGARGEKHPLAPIHDEHETVVEGRKRVVLAILVVLGAVAQVQISIAVSAKAYRKRNLRLSGEFCHLDQWHVAPNQIPILAHCL